jgi:hypothetical protein
MAFIHLECRRWGEVAFANFPLLLDQNGNDRGHSKVGSCSTISTCQLYKVANRKGGVGDTAAKTPTPTARDIRSTGTVLVNGCRDENVQCKLYHNNRKEAIMSYIFRLFGRSTGVITHILTLISVIIIVTWCLLNYFGLFHQPLTDSMFSNCFLYEYPKRYLCICWKQEHNYSKTCLKRTLY